MAKRNYDHLLKLILIGDSGVGKTDLLFAFSDDAFNTTFTQAIGIDFKVKTIDMNGIKLKLQMCRTGTVPHYFICIHRGAGGAMLVYDITNHKSFENLSKWMRDVKENGNADMGIVVVGNNCELEEQRQVSLAEGIQFTREHGLSLLQFFEVSAKLNYNVSTAFHKLAEISMPKKTNEDKLDKAC